MTLLSELWSERSLISRTWYRTPGAAAATAPAGAVKMRISAVGAGGWPTLGFSGGGGGGAAYARTFLTVAPGATFTLQIGDIAATLDTNANVLGDSICTRDGDSVVVCKAARGGGSGGFNIGPAGLAANSIGDVTRDGSPGTTFGGGDSAGDDADPFPLGFGGQAVRWFGFGTSDVHAAARGAGGAKRYPVYYVEEFSFVRWQDFAPGNGQICIEFFNADPGYT